MTFYIFNSINGFVVFWGGSIEDPVIPTWYRVLDECFLVFFVFPVALYCSYFTGLSKCVRSLMLASILMLLIVVVKEAVVWGELVNYRFIRLLLMFNIIVLSLEVVHRSDLLSSLFVNVCLITTASLILSVVHYYAIPYGVYDGRLVGAYGNPNTIGYISVLNVVAFGILYQLGYRFSVALTCIAISCLSLMLSLSFISYIQFLFVFVVMVLFCGSSIFRDVRLISFVLAELLLVYFLGGMDYSAIPSKASSLANNSDSVSVRMRAFVECRDLAMTGGGLLIGSPHPRNDFWYDSTLLNVFVKYGVTGVMVLCCAVYMCFVRVVNGAFECVNLTVRPVFYMALALMVSFAMNSLAHYQLEAPASFYLSLLFVYFSMNLRDVLSGSCCE